MKIEGTFILRYRVFDIFSKALGESDLVVQAECYGGPFRIYSTKEFPGLQASTDLTKVSAALFFILFLTPVSRVFFLQQLARWGVRLNIRETERRRRKKGERRTSSPPSPLSPGKKGKQAVSHDYPGEDSESDGD